VVVLRIRQAQCALGDGRLDEAFELLRAQDVRGHRRGQELMGRLARALAKRGQDHLAATRLQQALADCDKADRLGGNLPEVAELRGAICRAMEDKRNGHERRSQKLARAKQNIENGWLSAGEQILADGDAGGSEQEMLREQAGAIRLQVETAAARAQKALDRNDLEAAVEILGTVDRASRRNGKLTSLLARVESVCKKRVRDNLNKGRIDRADSLLRLVEPVAPRSIDIEEPG
jgi:tetratricopeptide (TPR) repeat protein